MAHLLYEMGTVVEWKKLVVNGKDEINNVIFTRNNKKCCLNQTNNVYVRKNQLTLINFVGLEVEIYNFQRNQLY
jgi:hypothetical protein